MQTHYRVVQDNYLGYEVQIKYWWYPFWLRLYTPSTFATLEHAIDAIKKHKAGSQKPTIYYYE